MVWTFIRDAVKMGTIIAAFTKAVCVFCAYGGKTRYEKFLSRFLTGAPGAWTCLGFGAFGLLGIFLLFIRRKENLALKIGFCLMTFFLLIPFIGHAFNGFSYVTNRFSWTYAMLVAYILVCVWEYVKELSAKQKRTLVCLSLLYALLCLVSKNARTEATMSALVLYFILLSGVLVLDFQNLYGRRMFRLFSAALLAVSVLVQAFFTYSPQQGDYVAEFADRGTARKELTQDAPNQILKAEEETPFWRYDQYGTEEPYNSALAQGLHGIGYYWSLSDGSIFQFQREMYLNNSQDYCYTDLDGRFVMEMLSSVKYFLTEKDASYYAPYGYSEKKTEKGISLYENENALPIGFTYSGSISREEYEAMSVTQKQQALLQGAVLENTSFPEASLSFADETLDYTVKEGENVRLEDGKFIVTNAGAEVTLEFSGKENCETYLIWSGMDFQGINPLKIYKNDKSWESRSVYQKNELTDKYRDWKEPSRISLKIDCGDLHKKLIYRTSKNNFTAGMQNYLVNLGYSESPAEAVTITFPYAGVYSFEELQIVCQPVDGFAEMAGDLREDVLEDVEFSNNKIAGTIELDSPKILCLSVPYSKGWTAYVDGQPAEIKRANTMYMALELQEGSHEIEFYYFTPYLKTGLFLSAGGVLALALTVIFRTAYLRRKKAKLEKRGEERTR